MCDTFVALGTATRDGSVIFGKNSDREPNEAHQLVIIPRAKHPVNGEVSCTYVSIPQVKETNAILLAKPFWIWGAEMGANEHGVVIGNEAVFTKVPYEKKPGLIGMDFLRLALERTASASEALEEIIRLYEMYYHNSFLIADSQSAWVLETAGKHWAAERVKDVRSISNVISIGSTWDRASEGLVSHAVEKGWCKSIDDFNFSQCYSDLIFTKFGAGNSRYCRTTDLLREQLGEIDLQFAMGLLRDHGLEGENHWQPGKGLTGANVCMHASFGLVRISQTTGSMVSHLTPDQHTHWLTGTAAPCTSVFKPVWVDAGIPELGPDPVDTYDEATFWWRHENLHREILRDYQTRINVMKSERDKLENQFLSQAQELNKKSRRKQKTLTQDCFEQAQQKESE